jgi:hypothetical protein
MSMKKDLRCLWFASLFFIILILFISLMIYENTKSSYKNIGYDEGSIQTKMDLVKKVNTIIGGTHSCNKMYTNDDFTAITFIEVKATTLICSEI